MNGPGIHDPTPSPRRRTPAGLLGMIALAAVVEFGLARTGREVGTFTSADWRRIREAASGEAATRAEVLCFGDSLIQTGVIPACLEERLDRTAYNLASMGGPTPSTYFQLRRALDAGARPRAIVVDAHEAQLWGSVYRDSVAAWAELVGPAEAFRLARDDGDPGFFGLYLAHLVPSVRFRLDLRKAALADVAARPRDPEVPWDPVLVRHLRRNRGALLFQAGRTKDDPDPYPGGVIPPADWALCYRTGPVAKATNRAYLDEALALARSRGITVFFLLAPIHPAVLGVRERIGLEGEYEAFARGIAARFENVTVVDARHAGFAHWAFVDTCHLTHEGATALSRGLAEVMAARLDGEAGGDRWVPLPPYAEPTSRPSVENLAESQFNVRWQKTRR